MSEESWSNYLELGRPTSCYEYVCMYWVKGWLWPRRRAEVEIENRSTSYPLWQGRVEAEYAILIFYSRVNSGLVKHK